MNVKKERIPADWASNPLWQFAQEYYGTRQHAKHLLTLQDLYGVDVLLLLTALWLIKGRMVRDFSEVRSNLNRYRAIRTHHILPIRRLRTLVGGYDRGERYENLKRAELSYEQDGLAEIYRVIVKTDGLMKQEFDRGLTAKNLVELYEILDQEWNSGDQALNDHWSYLATGLDLMA